MTEKNHPSDMFVSPCQSKCQLDAFTGECIGCGRTSKEIATWTRMTHYERMQVMKRLGYGKRTTTQNRMAREAARRNALNGRKD
jgi:predicted Fe-S protein YdhL (DUF1289 family)